MDCHVQSLHKGLVPIRFHLLDALILTSRGLTVCPIVHSQSTSAQRFAKASLSEIILQEGNSNGRLSRKSRPSTEEITIIGRIG